MLSKKRYLVFLVDVLLIAAAYCLAFLLRFDFSLPVAQRTLFLEGLLVTMAIKPLVFVACGVYRSLWQYASMQDAVEIFKVVSLSSVLSALGILFVHEFEPFSRAVFLIDWFLLLFMVAGSRICWRVVRETYFLPLPRKGTRTLIVGAGQAASILLKDLRRQADESHQVLGFVDDDPAKRNMRLHGLPVLGALEQIGTVVRKYGVEEVIIAMPSAEPTVIRNVVHSCEKAKVRFRTVPSIIQLIDGQVTLAQIKDVEIEDLLGRKPVKLDEAGIRNYLYDKRVLVTGAAGSIGSELCRQVARFHPYKLILLDSAETPLFYVERELATAYPGLRIVPVVADVRNEDRIGMVFDEFSPEVVFHAAAYKHVPMMEYNPIEAVTNNILGTRTLADTAHRCGVADFVMISTDKAVNPTNVMGASKRAAEVYVQALAKKSRTKFTTVRFGNVLGSNGSVIPLFKEQIRNGGPVTVTDPEMRRYFMTIPEASQLVLQAACLGRGGEIFVLDMGDPVKILDLAEELIRLSGLVPNQDIPIVFTGVRPGEKLFEELLIAGEGIKPTSHTKIKVAAAVELDLSSVTSSLNCMAAQVSLQDLVGVMGLLHDLVPEFKQDYSQEGSIPYPIRRARPDLFAPQRTRTLTGAPISGSTH